ncbi:MAG TPA: alpha amylase C-terminal domain-containing protein [Syntrophales bacterium]|nr:alpha amylase C-terminal domain-containing protein [Syntrophales bacterium]HOX94672.1 alpha amylase C-terminal domain-containing protein [Syntrophales bacterium]HPI56864.1 alpha amylase C-terminal domain-containing protein [Syntrophales bacterium]HPN23450.1 alpha amylase C-terminal domain-containing protein [Syntrophales bacterium]HQM28025.1 alpha amylase C-terminal domain-containing protein [Syntrophales bacterium]
MKKLTDRLIQKDALLESYRESIERRLEKTVETESRLTEGKMSLAEFASGHEYFGLHLRDGRWVFREWAPNASALSLVGDMTDWKEKKGFALDRAGTDGIWEISLPADSLKHGDLYRLRVHWPAGKGDRIPAWTRRAVQDPETLIFNAQVWSPPEPYRWRNPGFRCPACPLLIYEAHVGMAQDAERVGTYGEFTEKILPRISKAGYNMIQLMAVQEHPYYGSFGYQVSNFFAASSRFGTPEDLKALIDAAHGLGIAVIMDIVHSHAASNEVEGIGRFDGTLYQYFHEGERGYHRAWDSRCFDYGKPEVLHFLLSNCRFWLDEYRFDGFRFDGVTSMLYLHHGLEKAFTSYDDYFDGSVDEEALAYLTLANRVIHDIRPDAVTVAEDMSGMPGLAMPVEDGGNGFDYRFAMGIPDYWIKLTKDLPDEDWPLGHLWFELNNRRHGEKTISYAESHDQALVGDKTIIFRLIDADMYDHMTVGDENLRVDRGMALHKMIRLITLATAADGYLNFMGNEFGHPEWIDFPREGNNWSYKYARRQWHLADDPGLKYGLLARFDRDMIDVARGFKLLGSPGPRLLLEQSMDRVLAFMRAGLLFVFNFHPARSHADYRFEAPPGRYEIILDSDDARYGGHGRLKKDQGHFTIPEKKDGQLRHTISLYLPTRTAVVLERR